LTLTLAGAAQDAAAASTYGTLLCTPSTIDFGNVPMGQSKALSAQLSNTGSATLTITKILMEASWFQMTNLSLPVTLAPGKTIQFSVTFSPLADAPSGGTIAFFSSYASDSVLFLTLSGTGTTTAVLTANPTSLSFGSVKVGTSQSKSQTITNAGSSALSIRQATVTGSGFSASGLSFPLVLPSGQSFTFKVIFAPTSTGSTSGTFSLAFGSSNLNVPLSGTGTAAGQLSVSPATLNFGSVVVGATSTTPATLSATGASVTIKSATLSSAEFGLSGVSFPVTVAAGKSVSFSVTFTPQASGAASGNISFASSASGTAVIEAVSGTGTGAPQHEVVLSWTDNGSGITGYNIYRSNASSGPYKIMNPVLNSTTNYTDTSVQGGTTYYYATTAVDANGRESPYSNKAKAVVPSP
jgi:hypothetical protein